MLDLISKLPNIRGSYRSNADLSKTNWFRVGGVAEVLFRPQDEEDLSLFLKNFDKKIPLTILGIGSNIIIKDGGIKGVVIKLGAEFAKISYQDEVIKAGAACLCSNAALYSKNSAIGNLEFLTGIPGSIGGAVAMNAGCYGGDISQILIGATAIDYDGNLFNLNNEDFGFYYRGSKIAKKFIFTSAKFKGIKSNPELIATKITNYNHQRQLTQPIKSQTGGSTFKNPINYSKKAWQLIDEAGCRGLQIGGAQMSKKHCNFMINTGNASASDLIKLGEEVRRRVKEKSGIELEWEIKILGQI
jgi:UDP-N-acetylmuramate dehydrogenase